MVVRPYKLEETVGPGRSSGQRLRVGPLHIGLFKGHTAEVIYISHDSLAERTAIATWPDLQIGNFAPGYALPSSDICTG